MLKCPFCHFDNEDGALFCEQCKSDLGVVEPIKAPPHAAPMAAPLEMPHYGTVPEAAPMLAGVVMEATAHEHVPHGIPMTAMETVPMAIAMPMAEAIMPAHEHHPHVMAAVVEATPTAVPPMPEWVAPPVHVAPPPAAPAAPPPPVVVGPVTPPPAPSAPTVVPSPATIPQGAAPAAADGSLPPDAQPRLLVLRGQKRNVEYPIYEGHNFIGRADEKPVDIDLEDQEPPDRVWCSRQHAVIHWDDAQGILTIEDLNSANGTFVNRARIHPGQKRQLNLNDVIQIGTVHMKVKV